MAYLIAFWCFTAISWCIGTVRSQQLNDTQQINPPECGASLLKIRHRIGPRFLSGVRADQKEWNWQVCLVTDNLNAGSGSLINSQWVLSHAKFANEMTSVKIGAPFTQTRKISKIIIHSEFNSTTLANDLALFKLETPVEYGKFIAPVCLPTTGLTDYTNQNAKITSFVLNEDGSINLAQLEKLRKDVTMLSDVSCDDILLNDASMFFDPDRQVCSVHQADEEIDPVNDLQSIDLGSPLMVEGADKRWYEIGVASNAWIMPNNQQFIIYTRVSEYVEWISTNIEQN